MIKIAFLGTPNISTYALKALVENNNFKIVVVVTTIDKSIGRSHSTLQETPVAKFARENKIPLIKTKSINSDINLLKKYDFDYLLTCAFGQFLSPEVLKLPNKKSINIHGSLLPEGRGGAPLHWAIIKGKDTTGISFMEMINEMDAGDYYIQYKLPIANNFNVDDLFQEMSNLIYKKTPQALLKIDSGIKSIKQEKNKISFWLNIKNKDSQIFFNKTAIEIYNHIRGLDSKPGAWTIYEGKKIKLHKSEIIDNLSQEKKPGFILKIDKNGIHVQTKKGIIALKEITIEGEKRKNIANLINGNLFIKEKKFFQNKIL